MVPRGWSLQVGGGGGGGGQVRSAGLSQAFVRRGRTAVAVSVREGGKRGRRGGGGGATDDLGQGRDGERVRGVGREVHES